MGTLADDSGWFWGSRSWNASRVGGPATFWLLTMSGNRLPFALMLPPTGQPS